MTAPEPDLMTTCPVDIEELAAFIDGRLSPERHAQVIEHLDTCLDCRDIVMTADQVAIAEGQQPPNVVRGRFWARVIFPAAAAAAIVALVFFGPFSQSGMERLVADSANLAKRPVAGRFSADFPYHDHSAFRSGGEERAVTPVDTAAWNLAAKAQDSPTAKNLHAAGVAYLHLGPENYGRALASLEAAVAKEPRNPAMLNDLAAAYLAMDNGAAALKTADRSLVIEKSPAALWNRAYALQILGRVPQARAAWEAYLKADPSSPWAVEVNEEHLLYLDSLETVR